MHLHLNVWIQYKKMSNYIKSVDITIDGGEKNP